MEIDVCVDQDICWTEVKGMELYECLSDALSILAVETKVIKFGAEKGPVEGLWKATRVPSLLGLGRWTGSSSEMMLPPPGKSTFHGPPTNLRAWRLFLWENLGVSAWSISLSGDHCLQSSTSHTWRHLQLRAFPCCGCPYKMSHSFFKLLVESPIRCSLLHSEWPRPCPRSPS